MDGVKCCGTGYYYISERFSVLHRHFPPLYTTRTRIIALRAANGAHHERTLAFCMRTHVFAQDMTRLFSKITARQGSKPLTVGEAWARMESDGEFVVESGVARDHNGYVW
jgi:hypothetical protein